MRRTLWLTTALFTLLPAAAWADAQIVIHTEPADAQVILDGKPMTKADDKPLHVPGLATGKHSVEVKKAGMVGELSEFELKDGETLPLNFKLVPEYVGNPVPKPEGCDVCPEMVRIPGGKFMMGSDDKDRPAEHPRHEVQVAAFNLSRYEVTVKEFKAFINERHLIIGDGSWEQPFVQYGYNQEPNHPVVNIGYQEAEAYIRWLNSKRNTSKPFRLPTEAEWEYAARAGTVIKQYWDDNKEQACAYANVIDAVAKTKLSSIWDPRLWEDKQKVFDCTDGYIFTSPVGIFKPNRFGLYDMLGNASEWTCSERNRHEKDRGTIEGYNGQETVCIETGFRVVRGGSFLDDSYNISLNYRGRGGLGYQNRDFDIGFRLAQDQ
jgi:formylglycine-generating enzyme required for sulfatase activity